MEHRTRRRRLLRWLTAHSALSDHRWWRRFVGGRWECWPNPDIWEPRWVLVEDGRVFPADDPSYGETQRVGGEMYGIGAWQIEKELSRWEFLGNIALGTAWSVFTTRWLYFLLLTVRGRWEDTPWSGLVLLLSVVTSAVIAVYFLALCSRLRVATAYTPLPKPQDKGPEP